MRNGRHKSITAISPSQENLDRHRWPFEIGALWLYGLLLRLNLCWWLIDRNEKKDQPGSKDNARAAWVFSWLIILIIMWAVSPSGVLKEVFAVLALLRLIEIFTAGLGTVLDCQEQARARSLITIGIYALQVGLIFAILEHSWASNAFASSNGHATRAIDFFYISWTAMTTIGNNVYTPQNDIARILQMLTTTSGLLMLGVLLAFGINSIPREVVKDEELARKTNTDRKNNRT